MAYTLPLLFLRTCSTLPYAPTPRQQRVNRGLRAAAARRIGRWDPRGCDGGRGPAEGASATGDGGPDGAASAETAPAGAAARRSRVRPPPAGAAAAPSGRRGATAARRCSGRGGGPGGGRAGRAPRPAGAVRAGRLDLSRRRPNTRRARDCGREGEATAPGLGRRGSTPSCRPRCCPEDGRRERSQPARGRRPGGVGRAGRGRAGRRRSCQGPTPSGVDASGGQSARSGGGWRPWRLTSKVSGRAPARATVGSATG